MARELYLHETVDIVGDGAVPYMEKSVVGFDAETVADRGLTLFGTWYVQGSTGRWPQVVNVWELVDGWEGWKRLCSRTNLRRETNRELSEWWREAASWRTGGFDRLLGAAEGSPTLAELNERGTKAELFVQEWTTVRSGSALDYLAAVREEWAPIQAEYGHEVVGLWETLMTDTEVCVLWTTDLESHVARARAIDATRGFPSSNAKPDARLLDWRVRAATLRESWREELMIPCPGSPMGPTKWAT